MVEPDEARQGNSEDGGKSADPATVFTAVAELVYQGSDATQMYAALCIAATLTVPGCDHASLLLKDNGRYVTVGASDAIARRADELERRANDGPCIDAIEDEKPQIEPDLTSPTQWHRFATILCEQTPIRGAMGFRLLVDKQKGAALNLFSRTAGVFDVESAGGASLLASFASVAINAVHLGGDAESLRRGLASNREIGKALGYLMMLHDLSEDDAFSVLRRHSQTLNIRLADVARHVIERRGEGFSHDDAESID